MNEFEEKNSRRFFSGAFVLLIGNIFVKVLGLVLKAPLRNVISDEGMNYYNTAYEIYAFLFTISTTGLPVALSKLIAATRVNGNESDGRKIAKAASISFAVIGVVGTLIMLIGAPIFAKLYQITNLEMSVIAVAPTVLFICLASSMRGYFQGYQVMYPTAVSEFIESFGKLILGILFAGYAAEKGYPIHIIAAFAALGITIGVAAGTLYLWITKLLFHPADYYQYSLSEGDSGRSLKEILHELLAIAIPMSLSSSVSSLSALVDSVFLDRRIQDAGFTEAQMNTMVGNFKTCAISIYNVPIAFVGPLTASLIPVLSIAIAERNLKKQKNIFEGSLLIVELIEIPCAFGICFLSQPIINFIFGFKDNPEMSAPLLSIYVFCLILSSLNSVTSTTLHTYSYAKEPLISFSVAAVVKVVLIYILAGIPSINIYASPITSIIGLLVIVSLNLYFVKKRIGFFPNLVKAFVKPSIAAFACALTAYGVYSLLTSLIGLRIALIIAIISAVPVYAVLIILLKTVGESEIKMLPKGEKLARMLVKKGIIRSEE